MKKKMLLTLVAAALGSVFMVGSAFAAVDLKLNPDTLRKIRDSTFYTDSRIPTAEDFFIGIGNSEFTLSDVENCLRKYGEEVEPSASETEEGVAILFDKDLFFIGTPDFYSDELDSFDRAAETSLMSAEEYYKGVLDIAYRKPLYKDTEFRTRIYFDNAPFDAFIERVEIINNGGGMEGWKFEDGAWRYYVNNTAVTGWQQINGIWYYFKKDTSMVHSGFYRVDGIIYHFAESGAMDTGWQFLTREDGVSCWYYFNDDGSMCIGWKMIDGLWYYFQNDGTMTHSCIQEINGGVYSFSTSGWIDFGWQIRNPGDGEHWYYFGSDGAALTGWQSGIEGSSYKYFFWTDGYTNKNGATHYKGTEAIGSSEEYEGIYQNGTLLYLVDEQGHLLVNTEVNYNEKNYIVDNDGNVKSSKCLLDQKLDELRIKFPSGRYWNHNAGQPNDPNSTTDKACTHHSNCNYNGTCGCNSFRSGIQCQGFAQKITNDIYGVSFFADNSQWTRNYSYSEDIGKGDVVQINSGNGDVHYYLITNEDSTNYYVVDNNWTGKCQISWDRAVEKSFIKARFSSWWRFNNLVQYLQ